MFPLLYNIQADWKEICAIQVDCWVYFGFIYLCKSLEYDIKVCTPDNCLKNITTCNSKKNPIFKQ